MVWRASKAERNEAVVDGVEGKASCRREALGDCAQPAITAQSITAALHETIRRALDSCEKASGVSSAAVTCI